MQMKWVHSTRLKNSDRKWHNTYVAVEAVEWKDLKPGDDVFIPGNLVNNIPTEMYGRHRVVDPDKQMLVNVSGKEFYENYPFVYKEIK